MLNEEKIKLMTGIAMYEKKAEKDIFPINRYFKGDYIGAHMLRSFVSYTFSCLLIFLLWFLYSIEDILDTLDLEALADTAKHMGVYYLLGLNLYLFITYRVYSVRYDTAGKSMKVYQAKLRRLEKRYENQAPQKDMEEGRSL